MITNIPTADDFRKTALNNLNLAFDTVVELRRFIYEVYEGNYYGYIDADSDDAELDEDGIAEFWENAQLPLGNALTLLQQGQELGVKGRIAAVSPYLLIMSRPSEWPRRTGSEDVSFSNFKTINASDLLKVHNTVHQNRLEGEIAEQFDLVRAQRNLLMHSVGRVEGVTPQGIMKSILMAYKLILEGRNWFVERRDYVFSTAQASTGQMDGISDQLLVDWLNTTQLLTADEAKELLGVDPAKELYFCPSCQNESQFSEDEVRTAQLAPDNSSVTCTLCNVTSAINEHVCKEDGCHGRYEAVICLSCGNE